MYIVKDKASGLYFRRGNIRSMWDAKLVKREEATVFRSLSGIKNCLGKTKELNPPIKLKGGRRIFSRKFLDIGIWEIEKINF